MVCGRFLTAVMAAVAMTASGGVVSQLSAPEFLDAEVSTNLPFQVSFATMSCVELTLSLTASPTNCVEVSLGTDADGDGVLSLEETDQTLGYSCGKWFRRDGVKDFVEVQGGGGGNGRIEHLFVLKKKRLDESWNLIKVVRRGVAEIGEVILVDGRKPGFCVEVR